MWEKVVVPLARLPSQLRMTSVSLDERGEATVVKLCSPNMLSGFLRFFNLYDKS